MDSLSPLIIQNQSRSISPQSLKEELEEETEYLEDSYHSKYEKLPDGRVTADDEITDAVGHLKLTSGKPGKMTDRIRYYLTELRSILPSEASVHY